MFAVVENHVLRSRYYNVLFVVYYSSLEIFCKNHTSGFKATHYLIEHMWWTSKAYCITNNVAVFNLTISSARKIISFINLGEPYTTPSWKGWDVIAQGSWKKIVSKPFVLGTTYSSLKLCFAIVHLRHCICFLFKSHSSVPLFLFKLFCWKRHKFQ